MDSALLRLTDETGSGWMEGFQVFPGITLIYNDFFLEQCDSEFAAPAPLFGVEHCLEGRIEWELENGDFAYMGAGNLMPCAYGANHRRFRFPLRRYRGLSLVIGPEANTAQCGLPSDFPVQISALLDKLLPFDCVFLPAAGRAPAALDLLYRAKSEGPFHRKLAVLELLLALDQPDLSAPPEKQLYLPRRQVEQVRAVEQFLTSHLERRYPLSALSSRFSIPVTTLRRAFACVYGVSIADYMRTCRVKAAVSKLQGGHESITEIALSLGYANPSKFSAVFRKATGMSPEEFRRDQTAASALWKAKRRPMGKTE